MGGKQSAPTYSHHLLERVQDFLTTAFSWRGPASLPYTEDSELVIRSHLTTAFSSDLVNFPDSSAFNFSDGRSVKLLKADGDILVCYSQCSYYIGFTIWLIASYPRHPPLVFLTRDAHMSVKANHPYVGENLSVHVPYLNSWTFPSSNLVDLVKSMTHLFEQDPPLYIHQPNSNPSPRRQRPVPEDPAEAYRRSEINKILESVHGDMVAVRKAHEMEMEGHFGTKAEWRKREQEILRGTREMVEEKEGLDEQLQVVLMNSKVLESWVGENEGKTRQRDLDVDDVFEPVDAISKQMLECMAADLAVDDVFYSLDKAVQEGAIPFEMYLKSMRVLSREQFFHRALADKLRALQLPQPNYTS